MSKNTCKVIPCDPLYSDITRALEKELGVDAYSYEGVSSECYEVEEIIEELDNNTSDDDGTSGSSGGRGGTGQIGDLDIDSTLNEEEDEVILNPANSQINDSLNLEGKESIDDMNPQGDHIQI